MLGGQQGMGSMQRGFLCKAPARLSRLLQHSLRHLDFMEETHPLLSAPWNPHLPSLLLGETMKLQLAPQTASHSAALF